MNLSKSLSKIDWYIEEYNKQCQLIIHKEEYIRALEAEIGRRSERIDELEKQIKDAHERAAKLYNLNSEKRVIK